MIKRTIILFVIILSAFYLLGKYGRLPYISTYGYFETSERYAYNDTLKTDIVLVGSSLSVTYFVEIPGYTYTNLSMAGRSALDGIALIMNSNKLPKVLLVEVNLFDNAVDSATLQKIFYPGMKDIKKRLFFTRREYKLHNLLPQEVYDVNRRLFGAAAKYTGLYSAKENKAVKANGSANVKVKEDFVRNKNIKYHSALGDTAAIYQKYLLLEKQIAYLQQKGVQVIFFETPVLSEIYNSERTIYKQGLSNRLAIQHSISYLRLNDVAAYQQYLQGGDGIHMRPDGRDAYEAYLNAKVPALLNKQ